MTGGRSPAPDPATVQAITLDRLAVRWSMSLPEVRDLARSRPWDVAEGLELMALADHLARRRTVQE